MAVAERFPVAIHRLPASGRSAIAGAMRLKPDTLAMTAALAAMTSLGPLATDMYLPSLPAITTALHASVADVQLTLSVFLIGFAAGQPVVGIVFAAMALVAAFLNAVFDLCLGCQMYLLIQRIRPAA